ncbi:MAG: alpha/beta hydrolase [Pseudomonadaceae bacterium]|nr:alpha/beta hydrolase [Pseudomonadaceae bacterium]
MSQPILHFAHANGFPGQSYRVLLEPLQSQWQVKVLDRLGHQSNFPVNSNWQALADELLNHLDKTCGTSPVVGLGHSLGGVVTYMAALKAPERFTQIILLDPPLLTGIDSLGLKLGKRFGFIDKITPAGITKGRRSHFPDETTAINYFASKKLFKNFHPQALQDYVEFGTEKRTSGGIQLRFSPAVELAIFRNLADNLTGSHRKLKVPASVIRGESSELITLQREQRLRKMGFEIYQVPGGHMFPLEHPEQTRQCLEEILARRL